MFYEICLHSSGPPFVGSFETSDYLRQISMYACVQTTNVSIILDILANKTPQWLTLMTDILL
jgi:hypothetical protein